MNKPTKSVAVALTLLGLAYAIVVSQRPGHAMAQTTAPAAVASAASERAGQMAMTAAESSWSISRARLWPIGWHGLKTVPYRYRARPT